MPLCRPWLASGRGVGPPADHEYEYDNVLLVVDATDLEGMQRDRMHLPGRPRTVIVAHKLHGRLRGRLGECVGRVLKGSTVLNPEVSHAERDPSFHSPQEVASLHEALSAALKGTEGASTLTNEEWAEPQVQAVLKALSVAVEAGDALVSFLNPASSMPLPRGTLSSGEPA